MDTRFSALSQGLGQKGASWDTFGQKLRKYAPASAAVGGSAAIVMKLVSDLRMHKRQRDEDKGIGGNENVITVPVPGAKLASGPAWKWETKPKADPMFELPHLAAATIVPGALTYKLLDGIFKRRERKQLRRDQEKVKEQYSQLLLRDFSDRSAPRRGRPKLAALEAVTAKIAAEVEDRDGLCASQAGSQKGASVLAALTSIPAFAAMLTGAAAHKFTYGREKALDDFYNKQQPKPFSPTKVRLVTDPKSEEEERAAAMGKAAGIDPDYASKAVLQGLGWGTALGAAGGAAYGGMTKRKGEGRVRRMLESALEGAALGAAGGTAYGVGHAMGYGRGSTDTLGTISKAVGHKSANLTGPMLIGMKGLEMANNQGSSFGGTDVRGQVANALAKIRAKQERLADERPREQVDDNTIVLNTPTGPVEIDAQDPGALSFMKKNRRDIVDAFETPQKVAYADGSEVEVWVPKKKEADFLNPGRTALTSGLMLGGLGAAGGAAVGGFSGMVSDSERARKHRVKSILSRALRGGLAGGLIAGGAGAAAGYFGAKQTNSLVGGLADRIADAGAGPIDAAKRIWGPDEIDSDRFTHHTSWSKGKGQPGSVETNISRMDGTPVQKLFTESEMRAPLGDPRMPEKVKALMTGYYDSLRPSGALAE